jgi:phosphatidylinositol-3-phosphatase
VVRELYFRLDFPAFFLRTWDENDYSTSTVNQVVRIVDTNYGPHRIQSSKFYDHYSLTKKLDAAFRLPCLNHACDKGVTVMADLFQE